MSGKKNTASEEKDSLKISQLGEELGVDPREICAVAKEMAIENAKVPASWVTAGQADRLRAKFGGNKELKEKLERKQRFLETGELPPEEKPAVPEQPQVVLGKETYELDRRKIFGVVATPGGVRVETSTVVDLKAKPPVSGITKPAYKPVENAASSATSSVTETPAAADSAESAPPKKFIGVQVVPPIRREPSAGDPRFGVVQAAPEPEKVVSANAPKMDMWNMLNDGRAPVDMTAPAEKAEAKVEATQAAEEVKDVVEVAKAPVVAAAPAKPVAPEPVKAAAIEAEPIEKTEYVPLPPKLEEVPVKWQPKHKAFGAKHKVKQKKHKLLDSAEKKPDPKPEKKEAKAHKHEVPKHAHKPAEHKKEHAEHKPTKKEGLLSRLAKKFLGK